MMYEARYPSPIGNILLIEERNTLVGLLLGNEEYDFENIPEVGKRSKAPILIQTKDWLDRYFKGERPSISGLKLKLVGSSFEKEVWKLLMEIPYGKVVTYQEIADKIAARRKIPRMSAQAVGKAIGHNPFPIIIPCHRVVGTNGSLTGYAFGIEKKKYLLEHEKVGMRNLWLPKKGTKL